MELNLNIQAKFLIKDVILGHRSWFTENVQTGEIQISQQAIQTTTPHLTRSLILERLFLRARLTPCIIFSPYRTMQQSWIGWLQTGALRLEGTIFSSAGRGILSGIITNFLIFIQKKHNSAWGPCVYLRARETQSSRPS